MIRVWRLCQVVHRAIAFSGEGARRYGGRWNRKGRPVVYTAATQSLAALEILVHVDTDLVPNDFVAFAVDIPEFLTSEHIRPEDLAPHWRDEDPPLTSPLSTLRFRPAVALFVATGLLALPACQAPSVPPSAKNPGRHSSKRHSRTAPGCSATAQSGRRTLPRRPRSVATGRKRCTALFIGTVPHSTKLATFATATGLPATACCRDIG